MPVALNVTAKELSIALDRWTAKLRFNFFYNYWIYDLYLGDSLILAGQALKPNCYPAYLEYANYPRLFVVDTQPDSETPLDPLNDLGERLELCQTDYDEE